MPSPRAGDICMPGEPRKRPRISGEPRELFGPLDDKNSEVNGAPVAALADEDDDDDEDSATNSSEKLKECTREATGCTSMWRPAPALFEAAAAAASSLLLVVPPKCVNCGGPSAPKVANGCMAAADAERSAACVPADEADEEDDEDEEASAAALPPSMMARRACPASRATKSSSVFFCCSE